MDSFPFYQLTGVENGAKFWIKKGKFSDEKSSLNSTRDRFHLLIKFSFDDTFIVLRSKISIFQFSPFFNRCSCQLLSPSVRHSNFCARVKRGMKSSRCSVSWYPTTMTIINTVLPRCNVAIIGRHYVFSLNSPPGTHHPSYHTITILPR